MNEFAVHTNVVNFSYVLLYTPSLEVNAPNGPLGIRRLTSAHRVPRGALKSPIGFYLRDGRRQKGGTDQSLNLFKQHSPKLHLDK